MAQVGSSPALPYGNSSNSNGTCTSSPPQADQDPSWDNCGQVAFSVEEIDLYAVLDVDKDATASDIKRSFHKLALRYHPDKNPSCTDTFQNMQHAYNVLSNDNMRRVYDRYGHQGLQIMERAPWIDPNVAKEAKACSVLVMVSALVCIIQVALICVRAENLVPGQWTLHLAPSYLFLCACGIVLVQLRIMRAILKVVSHILLILTFLCIALSADNIIQPWAAGIPYFFFDVVFTVSLYVSRKKKSKRKRNLCAIIILSFLRIFSVLLFITCLCGYVSDKDMPLYLATIPIYFVFAFQIATVVPGSFWGRSSREILYYCLFASAGIAQTALFTFRLYDPTKISIATTFTPIWLLLCGIVISSGLIFLIFRTSPIEKVKNQTRSSDCNSRSRLREYARETVCFTLEVAKKGHLLPPPSPCDQRPPCPSVNIDIGQDAVSPPAKRAQRMSFSWTSSSRKVQTGLTSQTITPDPTSSRLSSTTVEK